jgi:hypothetical protein
MLVCPLTIDDREATIAIGGDFLRGKMIDSK